MKKFLYLLIGMIAIACSREVLNPENVEEQNPMFPDDVKMYEVTLDMKNVDGDLAVGTEPLSKADDGSNDLWWFQINYKPETGGSFTPYAYGVFERLENMTVRLAEGYVYDIYANWIRNGKNKLYQAGDTAWCYPVAGAIIGGWPCKTSVVTTNSFVISSVGLPANSTYTYLYERNSPTDEFVDYYGYYTSDYPMIDRYYGVVKDYIPVEGGKVAINMYRMQMGYRIEAQPFESGKLVVEFLDWRDTIFAGAEIQTIERDMQYSDSWYSINGQEEVGVMSYNAPLDITWISDDGREVIIYNEDVIVQRLKRTILKISLKQVDSHENAIEFTTEDVEVVDGEIVEIEGNINDGHDTEITPGA